MGLSGLRERKEFEYEFAQSIGGLRLSTSEWPFPQINIHTSLRSCHAVIAGEACTNTTRFIMVGPTVETQI